jgi:SpoVK/Ycf46/Vps4 family AAA+-type ATPase
MNDLGYSKHIKKGYRALFYGPPGTGKTLAATLLGKEAGLDVYRIDLSKVVSKYIGETEKNLASVFDQAENKSWVLFFDEADALFGQRTSTRSSNDRYANQEVSYLLQRIEDFPGVVILSSNLKGNLDQAFIRRLQSVIYFPVPDEHTRLRLWKSIIQDEKILNKDIQLAKLAQEHTITGGAMINVIRHALLKASGRESAKITIEDIKIGISRERRKEGKE